MKLELTDNNDICRSALEFPDCSGIRKLPTRIRKREGGLFGLFLGERRGIGGGGGLKGVFLGAGAGLRTSRTWAHGDPICRRDRNDRGPGDRGLITDQ